MNAAIGFYMDKPVPFPLLYHQTEAIKLEREGQVSTTPSPRSE
jgi:hypothetical protein